MAQFVTIATNSTVTRIFWPLAMVCTMTLGGCSNGPTVVDGSMPVEISGRTFMLEIVADDESRTLGLGGRESLDPDKGMLFSFPDARLRRFVMRDCLIDIDIIYLDAAGRIVAMHAMEVEEPQGPGESQYDYEMRLKKYPSRYNAQYVIELLGGTLETLDLEEGETIELDTAYLQSITQ
ncbi:MAG: DUF192 domain-containing protein [Phycisphaerales bacterium]